MRRKKKLAGRNIFIENDLMWKERKVQERINAWANVQKKRIKYINRLWKSKDKRYLEILK